MFERGLTMNSFIIHFRVSQLPRYLSVSVTSLTLLLLVCLVGCDSSPCPSGQTLEGAFPNAEALKENPYRSFDAACVLPGPHGTLRHGFYKKWYPGGKLLKAEYTYEGGIKHGEYTLYYPSGNKKEAGSYLYGIKNGKYAAWHRNGLIHIEGEYADGQKNGDFAIYSDNGKMIKKGPYFIGVKHGKWTNEYIPLRGESVTIKSFYHYGQIATSQ